MLPLERRARVFSRAVGLLVVGAAVLPGAAHATTASVVGGTIRIVDSNGVADHVDISPAGSVTEGKVWRISGVDPGPGCDSGGGGAMCSGGRFLGPTRSGSVTITPHPFEPVR